MSTTNNFSLDQGTSLRVNFDLKTDGVALDITGYTLNIPVRKTYGAGSRVINASIENGEIVVNDAATGDVTWIILPYKTDNIPFIGTGTIQNLIYNLDATSPSGQVYRHSSGNITLNRRITK